MREILFRAKHIHVIPKNEHLDGTWVYGYLSDKDYINSPELEGEFLVDPETVCQYTGLTDKNGKKIFEGDIVVESDYLGIVYFENGEYKITWRDLDEHLRHDIAFWVKERNLEIVGNVYDNPDLLATSSTDSD